MLDEVFGEFPLARSSAINDGYARRGAYPQLPAFDDDRLVFVDHHGGGWFSVSSPSWTPDAEAPGAPAPARSPHGRYVERSIAH